MTIGTTRWYRVVGASRRTKEEALRSRRGRFHSDPVGEPTTYLGDSPETAWLEVSAHLGQARANPRAFRLLEVEVPDDISRGFKDFRQEGTRETHQSECAGQAREAT